MKKYLYLIGVILFVSCEKEYNPYVSEKEPFVGFWTHDSHTDSTQIFRRTSELDRDNYSFAIYGDGEFREIKNSGWCATPPIHYSEYEGTWMEITPDTLLIDTEFWGGDMKFHLIIKNVNKKKMEVRVEHLNLESEES